MKRIIFTLSLLLATYYTSAQPQNRGERCAGLHTFQCQQIIKTLQLSGTKAEKFQTLYTEYNEAQRELRTPPPAAYKRADFSEDQIDSMTLKSFEATRESIELRREYYTKFKAILKPSEIAKMYHTEWKIRDRAIEELYRRDHHREN